MTTADPSSERILSDRRVAIYGGSFDPPHVGHTMGCAYVLATADVDELWLVPCHDHAFSKDLAEFRHRFAMCRLAVQDFAPDRVKVSDVEQRLGGTSRTIDTVRHLRSCHGPDTRFDLVVGTDIFPERHGWKEFDELERQCRFFVLGRAGHPAPAGHATSPAIADVSSTEVRAAVRAGQPIDRLVPRAVALYIEKNGLYRAALLGKDVA